MNTKIETTKIISLKITQKKYDSFDEIVKVCHLNTGYCSHLEDDSVCKNRILADISSNKEEDIFLYYEGKNQRISDGSDFYNYFDSNGFKVIKKTHPSILFNSMKKLTEEKLTQLGIPNYVDVVLPTEKQFLFFNEEGRSGFLLVNRDRGNRKLNFVGFHGVWSPDFAFLLCKKKT